MKRWLIVTIIILIFVIFIVILGNNKITYAKIPLNQTSDCNVEMARSYFLKCGFECTKGIIYDNFRDASSSNDNDRSVQCQNGGYYCQCKTTLYYYIKGNLLYK